MRRRLNVLLREAQNTSTLTKEQHASPLGVWTDYVLRDNNLGSHWSFVCYCEFSDLSKHIKVHKVKYKIIIGDPDITHTIATSCKFYKLVIHTDLGTTPTWPRLRASKGCILTT